MEQVFGTYATDVGDEAWAFCAPCLTLMSEDAPQREDPLRAVFNALRYMVRAGCPWRLWPNDLPPWWVVQQQAMRWIAAAWFEAMAHDLRAVRRIALGREHAVPTAVILDSRTLQSTPESGTRAGYDGAKRRKGSKVHIAVDTLGHLLAAPTALDLTSAWHALGELDVASGRICDAYGILRPTGSSGPLVGRSRFGRCRAAHPHPRCALPMAMVKARLFSAPRAHFG